MAANLRIIYANQVDTATVTASSSASVSLGVTNLLSDVKTSVWRSIGTTARLDVLLASAGVVGGVVLPFTNLSAAATMRVRMTNEAAAVNLLAYPRTFDSVAHLAPNALTLVPRCVLTPDDQMAGYMAFETSATGLHGQDQAAIQFVSGTTYTFSLLVKPIGGRQVALYFPATLFNGRYAVFDIVNGLVTSSASGVTARITPYKYGWYRCSITETCVATSFSRPTYFSYNGGISFAGDPTKGLCLWHAQLEVGSAATSIIPDGTSFTSRATGASYTDVAGVVRVAAANVARTDYDPVTHISRGLLVEQAATNLFTFPRNFDNSIWSKNPAGITAVPNVTLAPNGVIEGDKLIEAPASAGATQHLMSQNLGSVAVGATYAMSIYAKAGERTKLSLTSNGEGYSVFDLAAGTVVQQGGNQCLILPAGNGWWRCIAIITKTNTAGIFYVLPWTTSNSYVGDGSSGLYLWHFQLELGSMATSVIPDATGFVSRGSAKWEFNATGTLVQYGNDVAVTAYDPGTLVSRGLSLEQAATNSLRNSVAQGAVAGTPGTSPNYWIMPGSGVTNCIQTIVGTGVESGIEYIDVRFQFSAAQNAFITFEQNTAIVAASGQTWTASHFVSLAGGSTANLSCRSFISEWTSSGVWNTESNPVFAVSAGPLNARRQTLTRTLSVASTARVTSAIGVLTSGPADITLRIGLPMLEQGSVASSPVKTSGAMATRAADIATSPQATRASDITTSPQVARPVGYMDTWQSYDYDSGNVTACPGGVRDVWGWAPAQLNVTSYGFGGGSCARRWTPRTTVRAIAIDISDTGNAMGYIEASRLVVGDYWSPKYNFDYGAQSAPVDTTTLDRSGAGTQYAIPGSRHDALSINMQWLQSDDRSALAKIIRRNGLLVPMFVSLYPEAADSVQEADYQVYGRMSSIGAIAAQSYGYYSAPLAIEQI